MTTLLLSIILVSGYIFTVNALPLRYKFKRSEGWGAYFFVAAWGLVFFSASWIICSFLSTKGVPVWLAETLGMSDATASLMMPLTTDVKNNLISIQIASWSAFALFLSWAIGSLVKLWYRKDNRKHAALIKASKGNPIEELMIEASLTMFPVKVSMKSRKVYVGWVRKPALENGKLDYISLIPLLSGCRSDDDLRIDFHTNYNNHYQNSGVYNGTSLLTLDHYRVVLPIADVDNASLFDLTTYVNFNQQNAIVSGAANQSNNSPPAI